jgi:hypothetical protein
MYGSVSVPWKKPTQGSCHSRDDPIPEGIDHTKLTYFSGQRFPADGCGRNILHDLVASAALYASGQV